MDISAAAAADIAVAPAAMGAAVVDGSVGTVAALDVSLVDDPVIGRDLDHHRGAWWSVCRGGPSHGLLL